MPQPRCGFRGTERGSIPLPLGTSHSRFGTVFRQTHRQALFVSGLSWLSYSRPSRFSTVPGLVRPVSPVTRLKAPHAGQVERSAAADLSPLDGITQSPVSENCLTHFGRWRPCSVTLNRVFPHRPHSGRRLPLAVADRFHRIECRDYSEVTVPLPDKGSGTVRDQD